MHEENKAIVKRWLNIVGGNEQELWDAYLTMDPNLKWTLIGSTAISGTYHGLEEYQRLFQHKAWHGDGREGSTLQGLDPAYGIKPLKIREVVALEDGRVVVHCHSDACGKNGVPYRNEYCWIVTIADGKISALYEFADTALIERAMFDKKIVPAEYVREPVEGVATR